MSRRLSVVVAVASSPGVKARTRDLPMIVVLGVGKGVPGWESVRAGPGRWTFVGSTRGTVPETSDVLAGGPGQVARAWGLGRWPRWRTAAPAARARAPRSMPAAASPGASGRPSPGPSPSSVAEAACRSFPFPCPFRLVHTRHWLPTGELSRASIPERLRPASASLTRT